MNFSGVNFSVFMDLQFLNIEFISVTFDVSKFDISIISNKPQLKNNLSILRTFCVSNLEIVIDFKLKEKEALKISIIQELEEVYPNYNFNITLDNDMSD